MDERLPGIAAKLALVRKLPGRARSMGEETHRFRLGPPLPESRIADFEREHGIRLPESYRGFLTTIGHAGAGPHHGLAPLDDWDHLVLGRIPPGHLATPFPLSPIDPPDPDWHEVPGDDDAEPYPGLIMLTGSGCSLYTALVVSGPARGRVVNVCVELRPPDFCHDTDFLAWYERWLDETLDGMDTSGFDRSLPFDQPALVSVLRDAPDPRRRYAAAWTLGRYPGPVPAVRSALRAAAVADAAAEVREAAVIALGRRPDPADEPALFRALSDAHAATRGVALSVLSRRGTAWYARARALLADPSPEVRHTAARVLDDSGVLTEQDLAPLLADPDRSVRSMAAWRLESL
ncbi:SMI1/KNR4 family protein [Streptomyces sirii]|uniref:SMI1/KNR4 family protein n=1 Tax=Streptomyces sirii TaxID=3127701 RepID=UPI003D3612DA